MTQAEPTLLVDFGTTTSTAALLLLNGAVRLLKEPGTGSWTWPSAVCLAGETLLVGTPAERSKRAHPGAYRSEFKRDLGDESRIPLGGKSFTPQDLVVEVLRAFAPLAERAAGGPIRHLVLTVPGSYAAHDPRCDLMIEAGERAGFSEVELLAEPVAAALAPIEGPPLPPDSLVLVYDFGGGTFDTAAVRLAGEASELLGHACREHCGGRDIDAELGRIIVEQSGDELRNLLTRAQEAVESPERLAARRARLDFTDLVRGIKHQLSDAPIASDYFLPANLPIEVQGVDLMLRTAPILQDTVDCCREVLAGSRLDVGDLAAILLVGGSTRMPIVADTLRREFNVPIRYAEDPGTAVVQGAARWTDIRAERLLAPSPLENTDIPLRWDIPTGSGTLVRWLTEPGATVGRDQPLLLLRTADGGLAKLTCGESVGALADQHAEVGDTVVSRQWLVTVRRAGSPAPSGSTQRTPKTRAPAPTPADENHSTRTTRRPAPKPVALEHGAHVFRLVFDSTGQTLISGGADGIVRIWDLPSREQHRAIETSGPIISLAALRDNRVVLAHPFRGLELWNITTGARVWEDSRIYAASIAVDAHRNRLAVAEANSAIRLKEADTGRDLDIASFGSGYRTVTFDQSGKFVAAGTSGGTVALLDAADLSMDRQIPVAKPGALRCTVLSPDGTWVAAGLIDGSITLRSTSDDADIYRFTMPGAVVAMATAQREQTTLLAACAVASTRVWAVGRSDRPLLDINGNVEIQALDLSADGQLLAISAIGGAIRVAPIPMEE